MTCIVTFFKAKTLPANPVHAKMAETVTTPIHRLGLSTYVLVSQDSLETDVKVSKKDKTIMLSDTVYSDTNCLLAMLEKFVPHLILRLDVGYGIGRGLSRDIRVVRFRMLLNKIKNWSFIFCVRIPKAYKIQKQNQQFSICVLL